MYINLQKNK